MIAKKFSKLFKYSTKWNVLKKQNNEYLLSRFVLYVHIIDAVRTILLVFPYIYVYKIINSVQVTKTKAIVGFLAPFVS